MMLSVWSMRACWMYIVSYGRVVTSSTLTKWAMWTMWLRSFSPQQNLDFTVTGYILIIRKFPIWKAARPNNKCAALFNVKYLIDCANTCLLLKECAIILIMLEIKIYVLNNLKCTMLYLNLNSININNNLHFCTFAPPQCFRSISKIQVADTRVISQYIMLISIQQYSEAMKQIFFGVN